MVIPLRSGRQNHPLGLGESSRRHGRDPPVLRRDPLAPSPPQPRFGIKPAGQDPRRSRDPRTTTLPLGSQPNASPFCDHLRCRVCVRQIRNLPAVGLQHAADNGLVAGSSPPGPTTHSDANRGLTNSRGFAGASSPHQGMGEGRIEADLRSAQTDQIAEGEPGGGAPGLRVTRISRIAV